MHIKLIYQSLVSTLSLYCCSCPVTQSCSTVCDPGDYSMTVFPVLHYLPEFAQTHVHWDSDAIQPSHPLSPPSSLALNPIIRVFPNELIFASGSQSIGVSASALVLPMNIQSWFPLGLTGLIFLLSRGLSRVFSSTIVQKHQFFGAQPSLWVQLSHPSMTTRKTIALTRWTFVGKMMSLLFNTLHACFSGGR